MNNNRGFTLIEVAMVMLIGGILVASAAALFSDYMKQAQFSSTERRLEIIEGALQTFLNLNSRYPCPAPLNAAIDDAVFGFEDCAAAADLAGGRDARNVKSGAVPVRTLNIPDDFVGDAWGGRFTYAVTEILTDAANYDILEGGISVRDSNGNEMLVDPNDPLKIGTGHYVVVSHGVNKSGATLLGGGGTEACTAGNLEEENCNADAVFRSTLLMGTANNSSLYDDMIVFQAMTSLGETIPSGAILPFDLASCPIGWGEYSAADGRVIVGADVSGVAPGVTGGADEVELESSDIPLYQTSPQAVNLNHLAALSPGTDRVVVNTGVTADTHENMPPYIALLYCRKN